MVFVDVLVKTSKTLGSVISSKNFSQSLNFSSITIPYTICIIHVKVLELSVTPVVNNLIEGNVGLIKGTIYNICKSQGLKRTLVKKEKPYFLRNRRSLNVISTLDFKYRPQIKTCYAAL
jgi:hypothetical protein